MVSFWLNLFLSFTNGAVAENSDAYIVILQPGSLICDRNFAARKCWQLDGNGQIDILAAGGNSVEGKGSADYPGCLTVLEAAGHDDGTHIVRFCSYGEFAFFVGATNRMFDKQASGSGTCPCPQNVFNLFVYQIVMDTIGTEDDAVTRVDRDLVRVNGWGQWATQRLGNTTSQPEIAVFRIR